MQYLIHISVNFQPYYCRNDLDLLVQYVLILGMIGPNLSLYIIEFLYYLECLKILALLTSFLKKCYSALIKTSVSINKNQIFKIN